MNPLFSIIVVALNPGNKLAETIESIRMQTYSDYEIVVKDGLSKDGSVEALKEKYAITENEAEENSIRIYSQNDSSIYDAMNQAIGYCRGQYYFFLNCGDKFYKETVLEQVAAFLKESKEMPDIVYGNSYNETTEAVVTSVPEINAFSCYRNVPCHQTCFYGAKMFAERGYKPEFRVRGDYEHFLWCYFKKKAIIRSMDVIVSFYEGGGFSETKANVKRSKKEHKEITRMYMSKWMRFKYKAILLLTLSPVRSKMASSPKFSGFYNKIKGVIYGKRKA